MMSSLLDDSGVVTLWITSQRLKVLSGIVLILFFITVVTELLLIDSAAMLRPQPANHHRQQTLTQGSGRSHHGMQREADPAMKPRPNLPAQDGVWQVVHGTRDKFLVYSAFYDGRFARKLVRVVAAASTTWPGLVWCRLCDLNRCVDVPTAIKVIRENWKLRYSACYVLCPLQEGQPVPHTVAVISGPGAAAGNHLLVHHRTDEGAPTLGIAVCVKPLHFHYNNPLQMLEFLELYGLLGVHHFILYNHTIGPEVACVLQDYISRGTVTLMPWQLNMVSQKEIRTEGLFAALNDCLYRSMYRYSYVALVDLDEYIIPHRGDTLQDLIRWLDKRYNQKTGCYMFRNAFFYLEWEDDPSVLQLTDNLEKSLMTLSKTRRLAKLHLHRRRSKYMCRPEHVVEAGNHFVWEHVHGHHTLYVPQHAAILHHYRKCEFGGDNCNHTKMVVDHTAYRYRERLVARVSGRWHQLQRHCNLTSL